MVSPKIQVECNEFFR